MGRVLINASLLCLYVGCRASVLVLGAVRATLPD